MNVSCFERFVSWVSYHLSNFQFRWSWEDWEECLKGSIDLPKPKFIQEVLHKCLRLSYHQRIVDIMPAQFEALIPPKPEPLYKFATAADGEGGGLPGIQVAAQLTVGLKNKCTAEEALTIVKDVPNPLQEEEIEPSHNPLKIDVFVQTVFNLASKSFSHAFAAIAKFHYVFKTLAETEEAQICVLRSLYELWKNHPQMLVVLIDKLLKTQIVECFAVANWVFSKDMSVHFTRIYVWEILHLTIRKMIKHVDKLQQEVTQTRAKLNKVTDGGSSPEQEDSKDPATEEMLERMEEKLEAAQTDQKNLFLIIFQRFIMLLTEHIVRREGEGQDYKTEWYQWTISRLQQVFMMHHEHVFKYIGTLETLLFTADIDSHILDVFQQFAALRA
jgi:nuclear cap-binding protein subunit 1